MEHQCFRAGLFDELTAIYPDTDASEGVERYGVAAASGSYAGVHIMLGHLQVGLPVVFEIRGPHERYKLFELAAVPVEVNSGAEYRAEPIDGKYNPHVIRRAPFLVYDALKPFQNVVAAAGVSMAFAFRCAVQTKEHLCQPWEIEITHAGTTKKLLLEVDAFTTVVPPAGKDTHKYVNWFSDDTLEIEHLAAPYTSRWYKLLESYLRTAHYGRQNMLTLRTEWMFDCDESDAPKLNATRLDKIISIADKCGLYWLCGGDFLRRNPQDPQIKTAVTFFGNQLIPGNGEALLAQMAQEVYRYVCDRGLKARWMQSLMDEPLNCHADVWKQGAEILHQAMPQIPLLQATIARESIAGAIDIWCPTVDKFDKFYDFFQERTKRGERLFVYTCLQPAGKYCNRLLDMERVRVVWLGWAPAKYPEIEGFLHWGGNWFGSAEMEGVWHTFEPCYLGGGIDGSVEYNVDKHMCLPAGDGAVMYPGHEDALPSVRLEAQRIGLEDLCLLEQLKAIDPAKTDMLVNMVFRGYADYELSVERYRRVKRDLLSALEPDEGIVVNDEIF